MERTREDHYLQFYTVEEVSKLLKIRKLGIYELIKNGSLRAARIGRRLRISHADLLDYIREVSPKENGLEDLPFDPLPPVDA